MQPLSRNTRHTYLVALVLAFLAIMPLVLLYASGYRYKRGFGLVRTGGIFVSVPYNDAVIAMDGEEIGVAGILKRDFYVDNLTPGAYTIRVTKDAYRPWERTLVVEQQLVTDTRALLIPETLDVVRVAASGTATASLFVVTRAQYDAYLAAFKTVASTTTDPRRTDGGALEEQDSLGLFLEDGDVKVRWLSDIALKPNTFCGRPSYCKDEIVIEGGPARAKHAAFYGGGVVYSTQEGGVFLAEADVRPTPVLVPLYAKGGAQFRIVQGALIVKDGTQLYEIRGL